MKRRGLLPALLAAGALVGAACSGGSSITDNSAASTSSAATTPDSAGSGATTTAAPSGSSDTTAAPTTMPSDLPACPTDALASATKPVELTFWHGMSGADLKAAIEQLVADYNASQTKVHVTAISGTYEDQFDRYLNSGESARPDVLQAPEYTLQALADSRSAVPVGSCITSSGFDTSAFLPSTLAAYTAQGVQWSMPFNVSNPVLFYNKRVFTAAGLDPNKPPTSLEELRADSQKIVDSGAAKYGLALESGFDSGGGWYIEQWFAKAGAFYSDNENGHTGRSTKVDFNSSTAVDLLTFMQQMINDKLAVNVGDNSQSGYDNLLKLADATEPAAMTIATSASLGPVLTVLAGGQFPNVSADDLGVGPMPGPDGKPGALIGGASLWISDHGDPMRTAAAWDFITYMVGAQQQSTWAKATGYVPVRADANDLDPYKATLATDPRFAVAGQQLADTPDAPTSAGPVLGPLREVRSVLANAVAAIFGGADVKSSLDDAAKQADNLIADYNARNS